MTATAALIAATLLAVPFWPVTGRDGAESALQEVSDGHTSAGEANGRGGSERGGIHSEGLASNFGSRNAASDSDPHPCEVAGGCDAFADAGKPIYVHCLTCPAVSVDGLDPQYLAESVSVARCESIHREAAVNAASGTRGLLQIHPIHIKRIERMGYTWDDMLTAESNLRVGASIHAEQGWRPWSCRHTPVPIVGGDE